MVHVLVAPLSEQDGTKRWKTGDHWLRQVLLYAFFWRRFIISNGEKSRDRTVWHKG